MADKQKEWRCLSVLDAGKLYKPAEFFVFLFGFIRSFVVFLNG